MQPKLTLTLILLLCLSGTWARKLVVTATDDNVSTPTEGMLRYHINNAVKDDIIVFDVSTVTLAGEISISSKSIVIDGGTGVTLDAQQSDRIFNITSYSASNNLVIKNLTLKNGKRNGASVMGGAMYVSLFSGELTVENCVFENNTVEASSDGQGGALRANGGTFINCSFINNQVTGSTSVLGGGGVYVYGNGQFINCVIAGNSANYAGGIYSGGDVAFSNCTITDNSTPEADKGGGISNEGSTYTNCIIWGNTSGGATNNIRHYDGSYTNCAMEQGNALATGSNIGLAASPFVSGTAPYDLSLTGGSDCIDAGTETGVTITTLDIAGSARISGNTIDIGAYESSVAEPELPHYATLPFTEDFEADWIDLNDTRDVPSVYWKNSPATGEPSWSREDDGIERGAWNNTTTSGYSLPGANGSSHSASYNSWSSYGQGHLDLHVDFSTLAGDKALYFYYLNAYGADKVAVSVSEDGGLTFSPAIATFENASTWERKAVDLGNLTAKNGVVRFSGKPSCCNSRIGIDDVTVGPHTTTPIVADFTSSVTSGIAPLTILFADNSTGDVTSWEWDFDGDGTIDNSEQNPTYTFTEAGTYTVSLMASNPNLGDTKTITIEVVPQEYASLPFYEGFDNDWIDREATRDVPSHYFRTGQTLANSTWRRDDDGKAISWRGVVPSADYAPTGALNTSHSARFFTSSRTSPIANLDLYLDFSTQEGEKVLSFWYINSEEKYNNEELQVLLSTDNGATFNMPLVTKNMEDVWTKVTCSLGNITATEGVLRFLVSSTGGLHLGIDEVKVHVPSTVDVDVHFSGSNVAGPAPLTVNFTDESDGAPSEWSWDFNNDGEIEATTQNPSFTYTDPGLYNVSLTASKHESTSSKTIEKMVFVAGPASLPFYESFDDEWVSRYANRDVPGIHWNNSPASGDNSWSRIDDGLLRGAWLTEYGEYKIPGANGTPYSAGFNSRDSRDLSSSLDLSIDFSSIEGNKMLKFWFINTDGVDSLEVKLSTDGGTTFEKLRGLKTTDLWERVIIELGEIVAKNGIIRFSGRGDASSSMGIDEVEVFSPALLPLRADFSMDVAVGPAPLVVQASNYSEGNILSYEWDFDNDGIVDATTAEPSHEYTEPGTYSVTLTVRDANGSHTNTLERGIVVTGYANLPFLESFEETWVNRDWVRDVPSFYVKSTFPQTGWSRDDDLVARGAYWSMNDNFIPAAANGTEHSARIPMAFNNDRALDFYIDFSTMEGEKILTFWSILPNSDKMYVSLSENGGTSFDTDLLILDRQSRWTKTTLNLGEINSPNCVLRFIVKTLGNSGYGGEDSGLDEVGINAIEADFSADVTMGVAPLTVTFQDMSTFEPSSWEWDFDNDGVVDDVSQNPEFTFTEPGDYSVSLRASKGFSTDKTVKTSYITVTTLTGIDDQRFESISLYPNPTKGVVHIDALNSTATIQKIEIVDVAGVVLKVIESDNLNGQSFDVSNFPEGAVFVRIVCNDKIVTKKLIIRK
jgi:PKD repeat protein